MVSLVESNLWDNVLRSIKTKLQSENFETWFNPIRFEGIDSQRRLVRLRAPNMVVRDWVKAHYSNLIDLAFSELNLTGYAVDWIVREELAPADTAQVAVGNGRDKSSPNVTQSFLPQSTAAAVAPARQLVTDPALNSKYTFDNFVVGSCN